MDSTLGPTPRAHDAFAFEEATALRRLRDRFRREERQLPTAGGAAPRPVVVDVAGKVLHTIAIAAALVVAGVLALVGTLFGFAGVMSLITG